MTEPSETITHFTDQDDVYELDHLGLAVPDQWGVFALYTGDTVATEFRVEFPDAALAVETGGPDRMTLRLDNRDVLAAWCGGHTPPDLGSDVLHVDRPAGRAVIVLGQTVERTATGFRILDRAAGAA
ncbi:hypothetical protein [Amycolatopsis sp. cmx-4-61]|uniref:hypothetical protein n=1 Tax=Amycolatopsis sp. cmx-4-61 TaxID=2790937 RepID=UPI00397D9481